MTLRIRFVAAFAAIALVAVACGSRIVPIAGEDGGTSGGVVQPGTTGQATTGGVAVTTGTAGAATGTTGTTGGTTGTTGGTGTTGATGSVTPARCDGGGASDTGVTADKIKIGLIISRTGPLPGQFNAAEDAVAAHFSLINAMGGICGRLIDLIVADDNGDATNNTRLAKRMLEEDKVFAFVGSHSASDDGMADVICPPGKQPLGVPDIGFALGWRRVACETNYGVPGKVQRHFIGEGASGSKYLNEANDIEQVAIFWLRDSEVSILNAWGFEAAMLKNRPNLRICYEQETSVFETGFAQFVASMRDACDQDVTAVYSTMENTSNIRLAKAMKGQGFKPKVFAPTFTSYLESFIRDAEGSTQGAYIAVPQLPFERCQIQNGRPVRNSCSHAELNRYVNALHDFRPGFATPGSFGGPAWGQAGLFVEAAAACGRNLTRRCVLRFLDRSGPFSADGFLSPTRPGDHVVYTADLVLQVQGDRFVELPAPRGHRGPKGGPDFWDDSDLMNWWRFFCDNKGRFPRPGQKERYIDCSSAAAREPPP